MAEQFLTDAEKKMKGKGDAEMSEARKEAKRQRKLKGRHIHNENVKSLVNFKDVRIRRMVNLSREKDAKIIFSAEKKH
jgi:hypothetical protein